MGRNDIWHNYDVFVLKSLSGLYGISAVVSEEEMLFEPVDRKKPA